MAPPDAAKKEAKLKVGKSLMKVFTVVEKAISNLGDTLSYVPSVDFSSMKTVLMFVSRQGSKQPRISGYEDQILIEVQST